MPKPGYRWSDGHPQRRAQYVARMRNGEAFQCGCPGTGEGGCHRHDGQCAVVLRHGDEMHLGHGVPLMHGGTGEDSTPWCVPCNLAAGVWIRDHPRRASRNWWR